MLMSALGLATRLHKTIAEIGEVSMADIMLHQAYLKLHDAEELAEVRADWRMGVACALIANSKRTKKSDRVFKPEDFFPSLKKHLQASLHGAAALQARMKAWCLSMGGVIVKGDKK